ncbi:phytoene/squalene synthase family protein [Halalkalibacter akibai]|uniref:Phytoene synthase n=1 Tax=Halalkalibacter akibai (strain ATCC 43226 / DSM 21942 / CIP 109018 / JCM 9157 / 1139) TaxID=1236973 RepID=W4QNR9_HALA3|nr:phytoene/squalene synthase family protein [Halalkalibacter akibai]GAE33542.1 phytoene synthase [Halalkalibacter akibai JCM 9157]
MTELEKAYHDCYLTIAHHSKTFAKAFSILPAPKRNAVWAVYSFCREVDDIVDEGENPKQQLMEFESLFTQFLNGSLQTDSSQWIALQDVFKNYEMDETAFWDMITGQKMDLIKNRYQTMEELEQYCYHVASSVGLMLLPILAPHTHEQLRTGGIALGIAMQITNVLRDVGEDLQRNRVYLPQEILDQYGVTIETLKEQKVTSGFVEVWEHLAKRAEQLFEVALDSIHAYPADARIPVKGAATMYRAILGKIRRNQYQVFNKRNYVTSEEKRVILSKMKFDTNSNKLHKV